MKNKQFFEEPKLEVILLTVHDVITTSEKYENEKKKEDIRTDGFSL